LKNNVSSIPNSTDHIKGHITMLRVIENIPWNNHVYYIPHTQFECGNLKNVP
jgi:hypothetical protein